MCISMNINWCTIWLALREWYQQHMAIILSKYQLWLATKLSLELYVHLKIELCCSPNILHIVFSIAPNLPYVFWINSHDTLGPSVWYSCWGIIISVIEMLYYLKYSWTFRIITSSMPCNNITHRTLMVRFDATRSSPMNYLGSRHFPNMTKSYFIRVMNVTATQLKNAMPCDI
jgi:hypothetical protein